MKIYIKLNIRELRIEGGISHYLYFFVCYFCSLKKKHKTVRLFVCRVLNSKIEFCAMTPWEFSFNLKSTDSSVVCTKHNLNFFETYFTNESNYADDRVLCI